MACNGKVQTSKDSLRVSKKIELYKRQKHRLEVRECEVLYNDNSFFLGDNLKKVMNILGKPDHKEGIAYIWKNINIEILTDPKNFTIKSIYVYVAEGVNNHNTHKKIIIPDNRYFLLYGNPINRKTVFADAIKPTKYILEEFEKGRLSYIITFNDCKGITKHHFSSIVPYNYNGESHIRIKGSFLGQNTNPINIINIHN